MKVALRFGRYCSVALLAAAGDWLLFALLVSAVGLAPLTSLMAARVAGGLLSFLSNRYWTWGANRQIALTQQGRRFLLLYAFSYALSVALFRLLTEVLRLPSLSQQAGHRSRLLRDQLRGDEFLRVSCPGRARPFF